MIHAIAKPTSTALLLMMTCAVLETSAQTDSTHPQRVDFTDRGSAVFNVAMKPAPKSTMAITNLAVSSEAGYGQVSFQNNPPASAPGNEFRPGQSHQASIRTGVNWTPVQGATHYHIDFTITATNPANSRSGRDIVPQSYIVGDYQLIENRHSIGHGVADADTITVTVMPVFDNGTGSVTYYDNLAQTTTINVLHPAATDFADAQLDQAPEMAPVTAGKSALQPTSAACVSPALRADVGGYAAETWQGAAHVERWLRVLQTFSGTANDATVVTPGEAQGYLNQGWQRWQPVLQAIHCLAQ